MRYKSKKPLMLKYRPWAASCFFIIATITVNVTLTGCSKFSSFQDAPHNGLHVQLAKEPISLDPALAEDGVALQILNNIANGLVGYDSEGKLQNLIAENYSV